MKGIDLERVLRDEELRTEGALSGIEAGFKRGAIETLNFAMKLCNSGATPAMIRRLLHNKLVEITGDGEKA